jgi:hypothetical protein
MNRGGRLSRAALRQQNQRMDKFRVRELCVSIADKALGELASLPRTQRAYARPISSAALQTESQRAMMAHIRKFAHNHEHALRVYDDEV